jgi:hypothetical protein
VAAAVLLALAIAALPFDSGAAAPPVRSERPGASPLGADPCAAVDGKGRPFRVCFDPGNRLELSAGGAFGSREPTAGGATDLRLAWRWRGDLRSRSGNLEWLRDMSFLEARALFTAGDGEPAAARALAWRGAFVRHRTSPFLLIPGPRPIRLRFPFDVGLLVEAGGASWERARRREVELAPVRSALLLDLGGHGVLRRLALGPEVAWTVRLSETEETVHGLVPFTAGLLDARAESRDGLSILALTVRGGSSVAIPGGARGFLDAVLAVERVIVAVNDRPVALYVEGAFRGGRSGRGADVGVGLRAALGR